MRRAPYHRSGGMAEHRPFSPSPRRRALAHRAGLHAASPLVVGGLAAAAALVAVVATAGTLADRLGRAIAAACRGRALLAPETLATTVVATALPIAGAAAVAAVLAHLAQTRAAWLPRRRIPGAPALAAGAWPRTQSELGAFTSGVVVGAVTLAWLWWAAPRLAVVPELAALPALAGAAGLLAHLGAALVVAWLGFGALDAIARHAALGRALRMTSADKRNDDRLAGADPRWRARRAAIQRAPAPLAAVAGSSVVLVGDDLAVAIAWDPVHRPIPVRTARGRGPRATQLLGLARRHRIAIHRDPALAAALGEDDGPVPEHAWPRLAELIAAVRGRDRDRADRPKPR
jgi:flagellar biosynthesis protein FlhB